MSNHACERCIHAAVDIRAPCGGRGGGSGRCQTRSGERDTEWYGCHAQSTSTPPNKIHMHAHTHQAAVSPSAPLTLACMHACERMERKRQSACSTSKKTTNACVSYTTRWEQEGKSSPDRHAHTHTHTHRTSHLPHRTGKGTAYRSVAHSANELTVFVRTCVAVAASPLEANGGGGARWTKGACPHTHTNTSNNAILVHSLRLIGQFQPFDRCRVYFSFATSVGLACQLAQSHAQGHEAHHRPHVCSYQTLALPF